MTRFASFVFRWRFAAATMVACVAGAAAAQPATRAAAERNVYAAGGQVRPAAPVPGDFVAVGGRVIVDQRVGGDATLAGGAVDLRAPVGDDARVAAGDVNVESTIGGELFAAGGNITLRPDAKVTGDASLHGGSVTVDGRIDGALHAQAQKITLNGEVGGDVQLAAEHIVLGPKAHIAGTLRYASASALQQDEGATVTGAIVREENAAAQPPARRGPQPGAAPFWAGGVFSYLALLACAAVFLLLVPVFSAQAPQRIRTAPWLALAIGFASLVAVPMLAVLLFVTILGIPLGMAVMALYPVLLLTGFIVGVLFVASLLPPALRKPAAGSFGAMLAYFALALVLMLLLARVPFVGGLALGLVSLAGIGACVLELYARRKGPGSAAGGGQELRLGGTPQPADRA